VVIIASPPPINQPNPIIFDLPAGEHLVRVFDPTHYGTQVYYNAHNDEEAIALYERAQNALICQPNQVMRLDNPSLRPAIQQVAIENNLTFVP